jgi:RNA polymerase sigma-70 factor (ECF subfamily)
MHSLHVSRWRRMRRFAPVVVDEADPAYRVEAGQVQRMELRGVLLALDALPEGVRDVMLLVAVEGLDYAEAAAVLGIPVGTVMSRLSRGRDRLRVALDEPARPALRRVK